MVQFWMPFEYWSAQPFEYQTKVAILNVRLSIGQDLHLSPTIRKSDNFFKMVIILDSFLMVRTNAIAGPFENQMFGFQMFLVLECPLFRSPL